MPHLKPEKVGILVEKNMQAYCFLVVVLLIKNNNERTKKLQTNYVLVQLTETVIRRSATNGKNESRALGWTVPLISSCFYITLA